MFVFDACVVGCISLVVPVVVLFVFLSNVIGLFLLSVSVFVIGMCSVWVLICVGRN